jgi:S1-C subfamily serine protease
MLLALGGGGLVLAALACIVVFALQPAAPAARAKPGRPAAPQQVAQATLKLDWPTGERAGGSVMIDKESKPISAAGEVKFSLYPGPHKVLIRRRGYEPIELSVDLKPGQVESVKPTFVAAAVAVTAAATTSSNGGIADSAFPIGTAAGPQGFDGWLQNIEVAQRKATAESKDILMVFACSDVDADTQQLARTVLAKPEFKTAAANYVLVVIDLPQTEEGFNLLEDRSQNARLRRDYQVREVPTLVLVDAAGRPYFIERQWEHGYGELLMKLPEWQQAKGKRDEIFASANSGDDGERLVAAEQALEWLADSKLGAPYQREVQQWKALAEKLDPENAQGKLEKFFETDWLARARELRGDEARIKNFAQEVVTFTEKCKFVDHDRAGRMFLTAAGLLIELEQVEDAAKLMERSVGYEPKDRELRQGLQAAARAMKFRNQLSSGTGFVISEAGYLLTNHHVVDGQGKLTVRLPGQAEAAPAMVVAQDALLDIALVKVEIPADLKLAAIPLSNSTIGRGANVAAFGYPLGDSLGSGLKLTQGRIAALPDPTADNMLLLDLRVNPGNSGGPLCDNKGNVVGMVTAKTNRMLADSYGMARPTPDLVKFLEQHLPADAPRAPAFDGDQPLEWDAVDARVSNSVLMLVKMKE